MEQPAALVKVEAISKEGRPYTYVSVRWHGEEISRLFLRPLEIKMLFGGGEI